MDFQLRQATPEDAEAVVLMQTVANEECCPYSIYTLRRPQQGLRG